MKKIILTVAPHPKSGFIEDFNYTPKSVAQDVVNAYQMGAAITHLHVLDEQGHETSDLSVFNETIRLIKQDCDIIIQGSTGGSTELSLYDRSISLNNHQLQMASLNMGSVNFGDQIYQSPYNSILHFAKEMKFRGIVSELEIFDLSMLYVSQELVIAGLCDPNYNLCFGFEHALPARRSILRFIKTEMINTDSFSILYHDMPNLGFLAYSLDQGAIGIRAGLEDSSKDAWGRDVYDNTNLFTSLVGMVKGKGYEVASICEAKDILGIKK